MSVIAVVDAGSADLACYAEQFARLARERLDCPEETWSPEQARPLPVHNWNLEEDWRRALLFHCSQGKDRTGCGAMLILFALGVDEETVMADFMLTNDYNAALIAEEREYLIENGVGEDELETFMKSMDQVFPEFMENAIQWMTETYGSPLGYITQALGVTEAEIQALRDKFLE